MTAIPTIREDARDFQVIIDCVITENTIFKLNSIKAEPTVESLFQTYNSESKIKSCKMHVPMK